jgi:hypothetical protein
MRLRAPSIAPSLLLPLFLLASACDDAGSGPGEGGGVGDGGTSPDGGGGGPDVPPATGACPTLTPTSELKGSVDADATWRGVVAVSGDVLVHEAKITIEAGTTFVMGADASIAFGWNSNAGSLFARGTAAAPIRFCGKQAQAGYFDQISVGNRITSDSVLEHVIISDGGKPNSPALKLNAPVLVKNVQVLGAGGDGVHATDFKEGSEKLTVTGAASMAVALLDQGGVTRLPLGGAHTGNGTNAVALRFDDISVDTTFRDPGVPYIQEKRVITTAAVKITFEAGVDYRLAVDQDLELAWNGNDVTVLANGTAEKPVSFGKTSDTAGGWGSIILGNRVRSDSVLRQVKVRGGGNGSPALDIRASLTIDNLTLEGNQTGLNLQGAGFSSSSTTLTITGTAGPPATVLPSNAVTLPKGGAFTGNSGKDWIVIKAGDYDVTGTLPNLGVPYRIEGGIRTMQSALTIEAGTTFLMAADSGIEFGWNNNEATVVAVGSADKPIVFKSAGDNLAGYWDGFIVHSQVRTTSKFAYVQLLNAGKAGGAALRLDRVFDVTNTRFAMSAGVGIRKEAADSTDYTAGGNTFDMCAMGNVAP